MKRTSPVAAGGIVLCLAWTATVAREASAQVAGPAHGGRFVLEVKSCPGVPAEAVRRILGIEIGDLLVDAGLAAAAASDRLIIRCAGNLAWVEAAGDDGTNPVDRTFRLDDFPGDAAPRALALAGIELLAARSPAVRAHIQAKQNPASPERPTVVVPPEPARSSKSDARDLRIGLAGTWRNFLVGHGVSAWGGQAQLGWELGRRWHLGADLEASGAREHVSLGETSALLLSCGVAFGVRGGGENLGFALGLGGRMGMARLSGSAADVAGVKSAAVLRPWGGPLASASGFGGAGPFALTLAVETGRSLITAEGLSGSTTALAIGGWWVAISLGGAVR